MTELSYAAALTLGLLGGSHCLVMCGGIGAALGMGADQARAQLILGSFQFGRVLSYTLLGAGLGGLAAFAGGSQGYGLVLLRVLSGVLLISMGCYLSNWWRGLLVLEKAGQHLWRLVQPITRSMLPVRHTGQAIAIGLCWGMLPCGLIYTALAWSATAGSWQGSASLMFCFGIGTVPVMFASGLAGEKLRQVLSRRGLRNAAAVLLIVFGSWTSVVALRHAAHAAAGNAADHSGHHAADHAVHSSTQHARGGHA